MRREDLFGHYERELLYLRRAGEGFSRAYPKVARRLALGPEQAGDPHVERLIESFAFLTARLQLNLDRQFPRFTDALLGILSPHLVAPIPSCGIAKFDVDPTNGQITEGYVIGRGTEVLAMADRDVRCRFATASPVTLWPVKIDGVFIQTPDPIPFTDGTVTHALRLDLGSMGLPLESLPIRKLRLFINAEPTVAAAIYESLTCHLVETLYRTADGEVKRIYGRAAIQASGFDESDSLFPYPTNDHPAYRLLQEYFAFPQKFLFLELTIPEDALRGERSSIFFGLSRPLPERLQIRPETLLLGCTPIVNLFRRIAEPIRVDHRRNSYLIVPDAQRDRITEVYSVQRVVGVRDDGARTPYVPLFSAEHALAGERPEAFWYAERVPALREDRSGTDIWLHLADLNLDPAQPASETLLVTTLCTNRGLAEEVPANSRLTMEDAAPVANISLLYKPSLPRYRGADGETAWKLISQLSLNHLSLSSGAEALKSLQEILTLYTLDDPAMRAQISALKSLQVRPTVHRIGQDAWRGFGRGLDVTVEIDERGFVGASPLVFGEVLLRFLGMYVAVNSFVQLEFRSLQRGGSWRKWPRITGTQTIL